MVLSFVIIRVLMAHNARNRHADAFGTFATFLTVRPKAYHPKRVLIDRSNCNTIVRSRVHFAVEVYLNQE